MTTPTASSAGDRERIGAAGLLLVDPAQDTLEPLVVRRLGQVLVEPGIERVSHVRLASVSAQRHEARAGIGPAAMRRQN